MGKKKEVENYDSDDEEGKRGATAMQIVHNWRYRGEIKEIPWNTKGQPCGEYRATFMSYLAFAVRHHCSVGTSNWKRVDKEDKQFLWEDITTVFIIPEHKRRWVMKHCGERLRTFRSYLKEKKLYKSDGSVRLEKPHRYNYISQADWDEFVKYHTSEEFKELSDKNSANRMKSKYNHHISRMGYSGLEEMLLTEEGKSPSTTSIPTYQLWKKARTSPSGECLNEDIQEAVARIDAIQESMEGIDPYNVIATATGIKEHPGRLRGIGLEMTKSDLSLPSTKPRNGGRASVAALTIELEQMKKQMAFMQQRMFQMEAQRAMLAQDSLDVRIINNGRDSCTMDQPISSNLEIRADSGNVLECSEEVMGAVTQAYNQGHPDSAPRQIPQNAGSSVLVNPVHKIENSGVKLKRARKLSPKKAPKGSLQPCRGH